MKDIDTILDAEFLKALDKENIKVYYAKLIILDKNDVPIRPIEGRVSAGSLSINGNSSVRRAGNISFLAEEGDNDLTDIDNLLSINKKVKILIGFENHINSDYPSIVWFNQGIFVISKPSLQHTVSGVVISLQLKDKMALLNGDAGGKLPTSIIFHEYDQVIGFDDNEGHNAEYYFSDDYSKGYPPYDTLNMPGTNEEINGNDLYVNNSNIFTVDEEETLTILPSGLYGYPDFPENPNTYTVYLVLGKMYMWNQANGWFEVDQSKIGEIMTVKQRIFDIIQTLVCNYGGESISKIIINDIPLELKASVRNTGANTIWYNASSGVYTLNTEETYADPNEWRPFNYNEDCGYIYTDFIYPGDLVSSIGDSVCSILDKIIGVLGNYEYFYDVEGNFVFQEKKNYLNTSYEPTVLEMDSSILNSNNYLVDFSHYQKSIYTFEEGSSLITSYSNSPNYENIKNDYHIWGKNQDGLVIHYHLVIKEKPPYYNTTNSYSEEPYMVVPIEDEDGYPTGRIRLAVGNEKGFPYYAKDWRAELYLQGLTKQADQIRPDIYEQEILDLFDGIYNMLEQEFKYDIIDRPNDLLYWIDYIDPDRLHDLSVENIGTKIYSYQKEKINRLYNSDIPDLVLIDKTFADVSQAYLIAKCEEIGQPYSRVSHNVYSNLSVGTVGYTAQETARDFLYQYTDYMSSISLTSIPIYYLDVNARITVNDKSSGIYGDYIINSINLPLDAKNTMTISASRALERV